MAASSDSRVLGVSRSAWTRDRLFWALHAAGWLAYGLVQYVGALVWAKPTGYLQVVVTATLAGLVISAPLRWLYRWLWTRPPWLMLGGVIVTCYSLALGWRVVIESAYMRFMPEQVEPDISPLAIFVAAANSSFVLLCWSGLYFGIHYYESLRRERERALASAALAREAQFKMLRYQLNPHFLFNTLNAISSLILDGRNQQANQAVTRLSQFLRHTLDQDPLKRVTLRQEIGALELYLSTEVLRFGERMRVEFDVDERARDSLVPSLLLQPLVENAVKYAVAPREEGGAIRIEARLAAGRLKLAVEDDGPGLPPGGGNGGGCGVGLRNTRERLAAIYGDRHRLAVLERRPGLRIEIDLPHEAGQA